MFLLFLSCCKSHPDNNPIPAISIPWNGIVNKNIIFGKNGVELGMEESNFKKVMHEDVSGSYDLISDKDTGMHYLIKEEILFANDTVLFNRSYEFYKHKLKNIEVGLFTYHPHKWNGYFNQFFQYYGLAFLNKCTDKNTWYLIINNNLVFYFSKETKSLTEGGETWNYKIKLKFSDYWDKGL
jgi:hypothetical protein